MTYAHSGKDALKADGEPLSVHLRDVAERSAGFAAAFGWTQAGHVAGALHDIGKASQAYQDYIAVPPENGRKGPDHSTAGAKEVEALFGHEIGRLLAFAIAGHHAGLADHPDLLRRQRDKPLEDYSRWRDHVPALPEPKDLKPTLLFKDGPHPGFTKAFLGRMLFSCLIDADSLATEAFYDRLHGLAPQRGGFPTIAALRARLTAELERLQAGAEPSELNTLRARVLDHATEKAALDPGLFTLTVPTGGGKTLTSLSFALAHAERHGMARVFYVIPYTSIIEQTADVFRKALGDAAVLEHHASFDWERPRSVEEADDEGPEGLSKLRKASENWDAPVVVTTAVQFFESLFAARRSSCRKLHNIARAVVVLDEAQTLPLRLLRPCMAALRELATNYGTSVVLCTATQPALRVCDGFTDVGLAPKQARQKVGFDIDDSRELAPDPQSLYAQLKRVQVVRRPGKTTDAEILARFAEQPGMLCIVNSRRHARALFDGLKADPRIAEGAAHLSTFMCPVHRREVLATVRHRLKEKLPVRLVATSLIEAGVDVDFPKVWRAVAGLDSIAQAAGRCNREGALERGQVVVFEPEEGRPPQDLVPLIQAADSVLGRGGDALSLEAVKAYFGEVYWRRGPEAMDAATLSGQPWPILRRLAERAEKCTFDYDSIAQAFRMIDSPEETVIVPYDDEAEAVLAKVAAMERPLAADLRKLQQYAVSIPRKNRDEWLAAGVLRAAHPRLGEGLLRFGDRSHYRDETGVDVAEPERRDVHSNIMN